MDQINYMFVVRDITFYDVIDHHKQGWKSEPERRKGESPQLFFDVVQSMSRSDRSHFYSIVMRDTNSNIRESGKCSTGISASSSRNDDLIKLVDEYFEFSNISGPIETIGQLHYCFLTHTEDHDDQTPHWTPHYLADICFEVNRLQGFLAKLYEEMEWIKSQSKNELV